MRLCLSARQGEKTRRSTTRIFVLVLMLARLALARAWGSGAQQVSGVGRPPSGPPEEQMASESDQTPCVQTPSLVLAGMGKSTDATTPT